MAIWRRVARSIGLHNMETVEPVVRRFLSLHPGRPCTEFRRAESERLLRAQPFLASATVRAIPEGANGTRIVVETVDEVPALVAARYNSRDWALALGNENAYGTGTRMLARVAQRRHYRLGLGGEVEHRQLLGRPYVLSATVMQYPIGERWEVDLGHAFLTDLQRIAWHAGASRRHDYVRLRPDDEGATLTLPLTQRAWDVGGVVRFGRPGRTYLAGGLVTGERLTPAENVVLVSDTGIVAAPPALADAGEGFMPAQSFRINAVGGFRNIRYRQARGLDALTAAQDLANGTQLSVIVGRSLLQMSEDDDGFLAANLFAGRGGPRSYAGMQVDGEARRSFDGPREWDGILGSARAAWYFKPAPAFTSIASLEWAGGWRERFPFLLELGDRQGGVRGFGGADVAGARRAVARIEERWIIGPVARRGDLGLAVFGDVGRVWAGDAPYGVTTSPAASAGFSVLAAVPVGSQRLFRVDVAFPLRGPGSRSAEFRFSATDPTRRFWETPDDVTRARAAAVRQRIFAWP